jgi:hypothetical protein
MMLQRMSFDNDFGKYLLSGEVVGTMIGSYFFFYQLHHYHQVRGLNHLSFAKPFL